MSTPSVAPTYIEYPPQPSAYPRSPPASVYSDALPALYRPANPSPPSTTYTAQPSSVAPYATSGAAFSPRATSSMSGTRSGFSSYYTAPESLPLTRTRSSRAPSSLSGFPSTRSPSGSAASAYLAPPSSRSSAAASIRTRGSDAASTLGTTPMLHHYPPPPPAPRSESAALSSTRNYRTSTSASPNGSSSRAAGAAIPRSESAALASIRNYRTSSSPSPSSPRGLVAGAASAAAAVAVTELPHVPRCATFYGDDYEAPTPAQEYAAEMRSRFLSGSGSASPGRGSGSGRCEISASSLRSSRQGARSLSTSSAGSYAATTIKPAQRVPAVIRLADADADADADAESTSSEDVA
ncbi:hypothetical protein MKEN_01477300 [Mycena kentingensis (nom. inval.)]|nr:hypothetical protein MKEN_01477300 [Mycena kentingensis (nom. inval.)]